MAQTTFEKTMRNVSISDDHKPRQQKFIRRSWQVEVTINQTEHSKLKAFMGMEVEYYNHIVSGLSSRMRTTPDAILEANEDLEKLYLLCAKLGYDPYPHFLSRKLTFEEGEEPVLPKELEPYRNLFFGVDGKGVRKFTDRIALMCQLFSPKLPILADVRRNIAKEVLTFYREQVKASMQSVPKNLQTEQLYKAAPQSLEILDNIRKRHLQIPKSAIKVYWNEEKEQTEFTIPYCGHKVIVPTMNFATDLTQWNLVILHQEPGSMPKLSTPWVLDIRHVLESYLIKYTDVRNAYAGSAFQQAKKGMR
ncbi:MAG: hypothetical protein HC836_26240 [Richelia sp. RM2_1_2]|nr:hypothetical protein [Richelia sp. RM2_1_2]